jgi:hypothetical protein
MKYLALLGSTYQKHSLLNLKLRLRNARWKISKLLRKYKRVQSGKKIKIKIKNKNLIKLNCMEESKAKENSELDISNTTKVNGSADGGMSLSLPPPLENVPKIKAYCLYCFHILNSFLKKGKVAPYPSVFPKVLLFIYLITFCVLFYRKKALCL